MLAGIEPLQNRDVGVFLLIETAFAVVPGMLTLLVGRIRYRHLSAE